MNVLVVAIAMVLLSLGGAGAEETILSFVSDATIRPDAPVHVIETIGVNAALNPMHHGICRDFPTTYTIGTVRASASNSRCGRLAERHPHGPDRCG
jgi:hypothetical protein